MNQTRISIIFCLGFILVLEIHNKLTYIGIEIVYSTVAAEKDGRE